MVVPQSATSTLVYPLSWLYNSKENRHKTSYKKHQNMLFYLYILDAPYFNMIMYVIEISFMDMHYDMCFNIILCAQGISAYSYT